MARKVVVLVQPGLPYRKTILYGSERAREMGAKLLLLGVVPDLDESERVALAMHEFAPYEAVTGKMESEINDFLEKAVQFCLDNGVVADTLLERGRLQEVIREVVRDIGVRLVVVPTPTKRERHHSAFIEAIRQFAHSVMEHELRCPVVSVVAT